MFAVIALIAASTITAVPLAGYFGHRATTKIVRAQRDACERNNQTTRANQRYTLALLRDLASTSTGATQATLAERRPEINRRIALAANRDCNQDYPTPSWP